MRGRLLLVLCVVPGCFYTGGINHAPEGEITVEQEAPRMNDHVVLRAKASDPDDDDLRYQWAIAVETVDHEQRTLTLSDGAGSEDGASADPLAAQYHLQPLGEDLSQITLQAAERGTYAVRLRVLDGWGAQRDLTADFEVKNQAPELEPVIEIDPAYQLTDHVYGAAPAHYRVRLKEEGTSDHEQDLRCGRQASLEWICQQPAATLFAYWEEEPCQPGEFLAGRRFRLKSELIDTPLTVTIVARVDDGYGGKGEKTVSLDVAPNRAACVQGLGGTSPPLARAEDNFKTIVVTGEEQRFEVQWVEDDVEDALRYFWSVRDAGGEAFVPLVEGTRGSAYVMPAWFRRPGQTVELRAEVWDGLSARPSCSADAQLCRSAVDLPDDCYQWVTWLIEFR